jgi:hypothetical protein
VVFIDRLVEHTIGAAAVAAEEILSHLGPWRFISITE